MKHIISLSVVASVLLLSSSAFSLDNSMFLAESTGATPASHASTRAPVTARPNVVIASPANVDLAKRKQLRAQIINKNTVRTAGLVLPKNINGTGSCCNIGQKRTKGGGSFSHHGAHKQKKNWQETSTAEYFSSGCWVIDSAKVHITSKGDPSSYTTSTVRKGLSFNSSAEYNSVQSSLFDMIANLNIPDVVKVDLKAKVQEFIASYQSLSNSLSSSHDGFVVKTTVRGTGKLNFKTAHSWVEGSIEVKESCCPYEVRDANTLKAALVSWLNGTVTQLERARLTKY